MQQSTLGQAKVRENDVDRETVVNWASNKLLQLIDDPKQKGTFRSVCWEREFSPDFCWVTNLVARNQKTMRYLRTFHIVSIHAGLRAKETLGFPECRLGQVKNQNRKEHCYKTQA